MLVQQQLNTHLIPYRTPLLASALLVLVILQGTSFTLSLALRSSFGSPSLASMVTLLWLALYTLSAAALLAGHGLNWLTWLVRYRLALMLLMAGTVFSIAWSVSTFLTVERSIHLVGTTLIALYIGFSLPLTRILKISAATLGLLMVASVIASLFAPDIGLVEYQGNQIWAGVLASKNTLGFWSAITLLLLVSLTFWTIPTTTRCFYVALAIVTVVCLYNSQSATSILSLVSAALIMVYLHIAFSLRLSLPAMLVLGLLVAALVIMAFYYIDTAELIGRSGDLTGRGEVWAQTWQLILQRPLTGFGYGTIWYPTEDSVRIQQSLTDFSWVVFHAHNGLLQLASEIGLPLTLLALVMIVQQIIEIVYCQYQRQQPGLLFVLGFSVALLVSNYSEARLLANRELYWIFFIALPISMLQQITVVTSQSGTGLSGTGLPANNGQRQHRTQAQLEKRRSLKNRLRRRRPITVINNSDNTDTALDKNDAVKRKLARRQQKAG